MACGGSGKEDAETRRRPDAEKEKSSGRSLAISQVFAAAGVAKTKPANCPACKGSGKERITQCPMELVSREAWDVIELAELYEKGLPPVAGGAMDQAAAFVEACRLIWATQKKWKQQLRMDN